MAPLNHIKSLACAIILYWGSMVHLSNANPHVQPLIPSLSIIQQAGLEPTPYRAKSRHREKQKEGRVISLPSGRKQSQNEKYVHSHSIKQKELIICEIGQKRKAMGVMGKKITLESDQQDIVAYSTNTKEGSWEILFQKD